MIYLAGPINGCNDSEANTWRDQVKHHYGEEQCIDPMRRDFRGLEDMPDVADQIVHGDLDDIDRSLMVLANCWKTSWGTAMEIHYAHTQDIPVISVLPAGTPRSPWLRYHSRVIVPDLASAYRCLDSLILAAVGWLPDPLECEWCLPGKHPEVFCPHEMQTL